MTPPGRLIDTGQCRLHVHCTGTGSPTVVFDAALGASSLSWSLVQPAVARVTRACSYDRAGFGWSEAGPMPRSAGRIAEELHELLQCAAVPPPYILVGHSFGGLVMRIFAARYAPETAGLILVDPAHPEDWANPAEKERRKIVRGVQLCRLGTMGSRFGIARLVGALLAVGAIGPARALVKIISLGALKREDEGILAPMWKLPPETRRQLRHFWTRAKFFEALGGQIGAICTSAQETLDAGAHGYGGLPLVTMSPRDPSDYRMRQQTALAQLSSRGRHIFASTPGHWIPLDDPQFVIDTILEMVALVRGERDVQQHALSARL